MSNAMDNASVVPEPRAGDLVAGARLVERITRDALHAVWKADRGDGKPCAAWALHPSLAGSVAAERFRTAAQRLHKLSMLAPLPHVLRVHEVAPDGHAFLADLWTIGTVTDLPALGWDLDRRVKLLRTICTTLSSLHALGIVHGCLRPDSILFDDDLDPVLADVGLLDPATALRVEPADRHKIGVFAAPEAKHGYNVDARADVYGVGKLIVFVLGDDESSEERAGSGGPLASTLPPGLAPIVQRCVEEDPAARYATVADVLADLERWQAERPAPARGSLGAIPLDGGPAARTSNSRMSASRTSTSRVSAGRISASGQSRAGSAPSLGRVPAAGASGRMQAAGSPSGRFRAGAPAPKASRAQAVRAGLLAAQSRGALTPALRAGLGVTGLAMFLGVAWYAYSTGVVLGSFPWLAALGLALLTCALPVPDTQPLATRVAFVLVGVTVAVVGRPLDHARDAGVRERFKSPDAGERSTAMKELLRAGTTSFHGINLRGAQLAGIKARGLYFEDCDMSQADLSGAILRGTSLARSDLSGARVVGTDFTDARLDGTDLRQTNLDLAIGVVGDACDPQTQLPPGWTCTAGRVANGASPAR